MWQVDFERNGLAWIDSNDNENSIISFMRKAEDSGDYVIVISNFSVKEEKSYRMGVPEAGFYEEVLNTDKERYGGRGHENGKVSAEDIPYHNRSHSIRLTIPPLATIYLKHAAV